MTLPTVDGYSYYINPNDSDEDAFGKSSSDEEVLDEVDVFLYGTPKQQRKALKNLTGDEASSSDDNFEEAMDAELEQKVKAMENKWKSAHLHDSELVLEPSSSKKPNTSKPDFYDDVYFDSDEEDKSKRQRLTDDELFYDPKADDNDQKWADKRRKRQTKKKGDQKHVAGGSDAVLSCPACMTILCMDCQQHSQYQNQFRAMFVMNCKIQADEMLHYREKRKKEFRRHKKRNKQLRSEQAVTEAPTGNENSKDVAFSDGSYHPVKCSVCQTEVALYDEDEVYHFFNVLAGHA